MLVVAVSAILQSCASRSVSERGPFYESVPDVRVCEGVDRSLVELEVLVRDEAGGPMPDIPVFLGHADPGPGEFRRVESASTEANGRANLNASREGYYLVTAGFVGFVPEVRLMHLSSGCITEVTIELKVGAPREVVATSGKS